MTVDFCSTMKNNLNTSLELYITLHTHGLVGKVLTESWIQLIGNVHNILHMTPFYNYAFNKASLWPKDAHDALLSPMLLIVLHCRMYP